MRDYINELSQGLYLEDYNIWIEWQLSVDKFEEKLSKIKGFELTENFNERSKEYSFKAKLFGSDCDFWITIYVVKGKIISLNLSTNPCDNSIKEYFLKMQDFLESRFGKPKGLYNIFSNIFKEKNDKLYIWSFKNIKLEHTLFDTNLRTYIEITIR